jgi:heptaprenyl diphosphate synthase
LTQLFGKLPKQRRELIAFLGGLALFLSLVEYLIPKPVPFLRLGLANIPLMVGLTLLKPREVLILVFIKVLGQGILSGTLLSYIFLFSLAGSVSSALVMTGAYYGFRKLSFAGIGLLGAMASNIVQLLLAILLLFGSSAQLLAPLFLVSGLISGLILGLTTEYFIQHSRWYAHAKGEEIYHEG